MQIQNTECNLMQNMQDKGQGCVQKKQYKKKD